jgi:hypothetical protein
MIFTKRSVDSILGTLLTTVKELVVHADEESAKATAKEDSINRLRVEVEGHDSEANRARLVADRLSAILGA